MRIDAYVTRPNSHFSKNVLTDIENNNYELIAFTSGGEIEAIRKVIDNDNIFRSLKSACFGPFTESVSLKNGLTPVLTGTVFYSFDNFADAIKVHLKANKPG